MRHLAAYAVAASNVLILDAWASSSCKCSIPWKAGSAYRVYVRIQQSLAPKASTVSVMPASVLHEQTNAARPLPVLGLML